MGYNEKLIHISWHATLGSKGLTLGSKGLTLGSKGLT